MHTTVRAGDTQRTGAEQKQLLNHILPAPTHRRGFNRDSNHLKSFQ